MAARPARAASLDPFKPHGFFLEDELGASGRVVSSGTILLTNKECPWRCLMCDLWKNTLIQTVPPGAIVRQIEFALKQFEGRAHHSVCADADCNGTQRARSDVSYQPPEQLKLYNSGSFFDPSAIPLADYADIARTVSFAKHIVVESHPRLVGEKALRLRDLLPGSMEVAMGLETIHPQVLPRLNKKFDLEHFKQAAQVLYHEGIAMRAFVLVKPPFLDDVEGIEWAVKSAKFAFDCGATAVSLIPTRGGNGAMERLHSMGDFNPPRLVTLERAFEQALECARPRAQQRESIQCAQNNHGASASNIAAPGDGRAPAARPRVFADTWDLETFSRCSTCLPQRQQRIQAMNLSQTIQPRIKCPECDSR